jgi:ribosomal protein S18 acetylase RimI-like enzyme
MTGPDRLALELEYNVRVGKRSDRKTLLGLMQKAYRELFPNADLAHLPDIVEQLWSEQMRLWLVEKVIEQTETLGCLWLGNAVDPLAGDLYPHIFLLYVDPHHRRRGLGSTLMQSAETWATQQGYQQLGLNVFVENASALSLYAQLGYKSQSIFLQKKLYNNGS